MKHNILILSLGLVLGTLSGCNAPLPIVDPNEAILLNLPEEYKEERNVHPKLSKRETILPEGYSVYTQVQLSPTIVALVNEAGYVGIFNLQLNEFIYKCSLDVAELEDFSKNNNIKYIAYDVFSTVKIDYKGKTTIIDSLGNYIYDGPYIKESNYDILFELPEYTSFDDENLKILFFSQHQDDGTMVENTLFYYDEEGKLNVYKHGESFLDELPQIESTKNKVIELKDYGVPGYKIEIVGEYTVRVLDDENKLILTYHLPFNDDDVREMFIVGKYLIYQEKVSIEDAYTSEFTYYDDEDKYGLHTYKLDLTTGIETEVEFNYYITNSESFKNKDGLLTSAMLELRPIRNKVLNHNATVLLVDENLNTIKDYSHISYFDLIKIDNLFVDTLYNAVYDENMVYQYSFNDRIVIEDYYSKAKVFVFRDYITDLYGVMNLKGEIIEKPIYFDVKLNEEANIYTLVTPFKVTLKDINLKTLNEYTIFIDAFDFIPEIGVYAWQVSSETIMFLDTYGQCFKIDSANSLPCLDPILGVGFINFTQDSINYEASLSYVGMLFDKVKSQNKVNEVKESLNLGSNLYRAKTIGLGEVTLPAPSEEKTEYYKFVPEKTGLYSFGALHPNIVDIYGKIGLYNIYETDILSFYLKGNLLLFKDAEYVLQIKYDTEVKGEIKLVYEPTAAKNEDETIDEETLKANPVQIRTLTIEETGNYEIPYEGVKPFVGALIPGLDLIGFTPRKGEKENIYSLPKGKEIYLIYNSDSSPYVIKPVKKYEGIFNGFTVENDPTIPFTYVEETNTYISGNVGNSEKATITFNLPQDYSRKPFFFFTLKFSTEEGCDEAKVTLNGELYRYQNKTNWSGNGEIDFAISITNNTQVITISYEKDGSVNEGQDKIAIINPHIEYRS